MTNSLIIFYTSANEKLQKLINKEDTLTNSGATAITAYRKSFKAFYFLYHDTYLVTQCPHLSKAQVYIKKALSKIKSKSQSKSKDRKNHRHRYNYSSSFDSNFIIFSESLKSENNKKRKKIVIFKSSLKKPGKEKKKKIKDYAYTTISDTSDSSNS